MTPEYKRKHLDKKWAGLEKRGIKRPESIEENRKRLKESRIGRG
jgi:hypothetical protein